MISKRYVKMFCCEDASLIENYEAAMNSSEMWVCHHRKETDEHLSRDQLKAMGLYYNRPASELIFLTHQEHARLHRKHDNENAKDSEWYDTWKESISKAMVGNTNSVGNKGWSGYTWHLENGKRVYTKKV